MSVLCVFAVPESSFTADVISGTSTSASSERERAAVKGLAELLQGSSFHRKLGIASEKSALESTIGTEFQVYTITPQQFKDIGANSLSDFVVPTNHREFIVMNQGQAKALIRVDLVDGSWKAVSIGAAGLAGELLKTVNAWPVTAGYSLRLIRVYQANCEFIEVSKSSSIIGIVPLISARAVLGLDTITFDPAVIYGEKNVVAKVRAIVSAAVTSPDLVHP